MTAEFARRLSEGRSGFPDFLAAIEAHIEDQGVPPAATAKLMIAFDEIISNVIDYSSTGEGHCPVVEVVVNVAGDKVTAEVSDNGRSFDPLAAPPPDTTQSVEDRAIGGLGIHLVRELMDEISYRREAGRNRLRFSKIYSVE